MIEPVLACLEKMADQCAAGQALDTRSAEQALDVFRNFADRCHHGKEEDLLFPLIESKGFSREQGPPGVMPNEHQQGRRLVQAMANALGTAASDADASRRSFIDPARDFVARWREHIHKEDHCLLPIANQALTEPDQRQLVDSFEKVKREDLGHATLQRYGDLATESARRFGLEPVATTGQCGHGGSYPEQVQGRRRSFVPDASSKSVFQAAIRVTRMTCAPPLIGHGHGCTHCEPAW